MRTRQIREQKAKPKRQRDCDEPTATNPRPAKTAQADRADGLLTELLSERDAIDRALTQWTTRIEA